MTKYRAIMMGFIGLISCSDPAKIEPIKADQKSVVRTELSQDSIDFVQYQAGLFCYDNRIKVPINDSAEGFMLLDTNFSKDGKILPENINKHYKWVLSWYPDSLMKIHQLVWSIPEMQAYGKTNFPVSNSFNSRLTAIVEVPSLKNAYYKVEIYRDYGWRFGATIPFHSILVKQDFDSVYVMDMQTNPEGRFIPIQEWRRLQN